MTPGAKDVYLYIAGSGRSGSTLLDTALGSHPSILGMGEIGRLPESLLEGARWPMPDGCACGASMDGCPVWGSILDEAHGLDLSETSADEWAEFLLPRLRRSKSSARVLVDSTNWIRPMRRVLSSTYLRDLYDVRVVFLTRDVRGFVYSASVRGYEKGQPGEWHVAAWRAAVGWWFRNHTVLRLVRRLPSHSWIHVRYEDLATEPERVIREIQQFVGVEPVALGQGWRAEPAHTLAGNRSFRQRRSPEVREDLAWRTELGPLSTALVELIAGRLSRRLMRGL